jgi:GTPase SAR1 family protein
VVFGETGGGKSSVINLIVGKDVAETSSSSVGCTFNSEPYPTEIDGVPMVLWDTAGLNEGNKGKVTGKQAIIQLYELISTLEEEGVNLLVFCVRGPRVNDATVKNYRLFHSSFCLDKVPIVLVMTGLEEEESMDAWWPQNKGTFQAEEMTFCGQVCITATKGKLKGGSYMYQEEYDESRKKVRKLIVDSYQLVPWKMEKVSWFVASFRRVAKSIAWLVGAKSFRAGDVVEFLKDYAGLSEKDANKAAKE